MASAEGMAAPVYVVMGVCGSGKTTFGKALSAALSLPFHDADDFHPATNVQKMRSGTPLDDDDRRPWLQVLARSMQTWAGQGGAVLACSALKRSYRDLLAEGVKGGVIVIHLDVPRVELLRRMAAREGHYMPASLLDSQLGTLQLPGPDELALAVMHAQPSAAGRYLWRILKGDVNVIPTNLRGDVSQMQLSSSSSSCARPIAFLDGGTKSAL